MAPPQSLAVAPESPGTTATTSSAVAPPPVAQPQSPVTDRRVANPPRQSERRPATRPTPSPTAQQPAATPAPTAEQGFLTIDADPYGTVFVDDVNVGPTPLVQYGVKPGMHRIRIENPGYKAIDERVQVDAGNTIRKRYTLTPEG